MITAVRSGYLSQSQYSWTASVFDNVDPIILLEDLKEIDIPVHFRKFVENLVSVKYLNFVIDGKLHSPHKDTSQGPILSPLLFDIYLRNLDQQLHFDTCFLQYADDVVLYSTYLNPNDAIKSIQFSLNKIYEYLKYRNLEISPTKSLDRLHTGQSKLSKLSINEILVPRIQSHFLEVIDCNLKDRHHLRYLIDKGSQQKDLWPCIIATLSSISLVFSLLFTEPHSVVLWNTDANSSLRVHLHPTSSVVVIQGN